MKKRSMTLLELLISLGLFSILLTSLLFWYSHLAKQKTAFSQLFPPLLQEHYAYLRIEKSLDHIVTANQTIFFSAQEPDGSKSLIFSFDHGVQADPAFAGSVLAKLYWDSQQQTLQLTLWPCPKEDLKIPSISKTYLILDHITGFDIAFFAAKIPSILPVSPQHIGQEMPPFGWQPTWQQAYQQTSALLRIDLQRHQDSLQWTFDLHQPLLYPVELS
ncbi:MAG: DUF1494 domain-containing protein [Verrucomicrobia bacterium]|nr:DUF1494 domain-containing protein [Verrucomicrobiota bacterium]MBS0646280.1 DUF1494 domain-containing protein [Verrucomicrobiota bacterium]